MRAIGCVFLLLAVACRGTQEPAPLDPPDSATTTTARATPSTAATTSTIEDSSTTMTTTTTTLPELEGIAYEKIADLPFPVQMTALPGAELAYIATKDGRIWAYDGQRVIADPVIDISGQVRNSGEQGLLSIAIHPADSGRMFVHYSATDGDTVVSEFELVSASAADPGSERVLLRLDQPAPNHNGGMILFGPGDDLFVGLGDGGGANDQFGNAQNLQTLLGGIVRLAVDGDPDPTLFDHGLRNPWRFWFDDGLVYVADVGQNSFEEVSVTPLARGIDFGWPITEGLHCFRPSSGCDTSGMTLPVLEVSHGDAGTCSITGGIVYRGGAIPELQGHHFFSDFCGGYLRSFRYDGVGAVDHTDWTEQVGVRGAVPGFGLDGAGEMYVLTTEELLAVVPERG